MSWQLKDSIPFSSFPIFHRFTPCIFAPTFSRSVSPRLPSPLLVLFSTILFLRTSYIVPAPLPSRLFLSDYIVIPLSLPRSPYPCPVCSFLYLSVSLAFIIFFIILYLYISVLLVQSLSLSSISHPTLTLSIYPFLHPYLCLILTLVAPFLWGCGVRAA